MAFEGAEPPRDQSDRWDHPTVQIGQSQAWRAANGLGERFGWASARTGLLCWQRRWLFCGLSMVGLVGVCQPEIVLVAFVGLCWLLFATLIAWRFLLIVAGIGAAATPSQDVDEVELPTYTVLLALYDEPRAVVGLAAAMRVLDWPCDRLDIKVLLEAGDLVTRRAVEAETWPVGTEVLVLPPGEPRTKPRALNVGLDRARGDFVTIYDAEDRPAPDQLRAAYSAFRKGVAELACVQAPLQAYNSRASWLAGQWGLEYAQQFGLFVPALTRLGLPVPLGGTSNHFRCDVLERIGGWDAWNVTEDADLGMRLARGGYCTGMVAPPTQEEAPETLDVWAAQRSRWLKGFVVTWMVLLREPHKALASMGVAGFLCAQLMLAGTALSALVHAPLMGLLLVIMCLPGWQLSAVSLVLIAVGYSVNVAAALLAPGAMTKRRLLLALTMPLYWPLQSLAMMRAVKELITAPHAWAKTPHGLTAYTPILTSAPSPA